MGEKRSKKNNFSNPGIKRLKDAYQGKRILITGHTGFKGSWLTLWLLQLGADVAGFSSYLPSDPCNYEVIGLRNKITEIQGDIRKLEELKKSFEQFQPEVVFHLAAQPIIRKSFDNPKLTFDTNLGGTVNILECIRATSSVNCAVIITSDKCYHNFEWPWGYRENDRLGGDDPYSASKASAEIACHAYCQSFFNHSYMENPPRIATTRAGNVIGGGDWAQDRIIPDCVRALSAGKKVTIRNPMATRPWQHVLEPLSGYLLLGLKLMEASNLHGESFNFGPSVGANKSVKELIGEFIGYWGEGSWTQEQNVVRKKENSLLQLSSEKALNSLQWNALLSFDEALRLTSEWYRAYYDGEEDMYAYSIGQINYYTLKAVEEKISWTMET